MTRQPDEDYDLILYECRHTWTVWLCGELQRERFTLEAAVELACDLAAAHRKPAWLLDETGYPLKPNRCATGYKKLLGPTAIYLHPLSSTKLTCPLQGNEEPHVNRCWLCDLAGTAQLAEQLFQYHQRRVSCG